jgi:hypothetical protein
VINAWPLDYLIRFTQKTKPAEMSHQKHSFRARADFGWTTFKSPISWAFLLDSNALLQIPYCILNAQHGCWHLCF